MGSRFFRHGELALVVLALLERSPMHGYHLIAELEALFGGEYEPSTGTVYPAVRALQEEGLLSRRDKDRRSVFSLTAAGRRALEARGELLAQIETRTGARIRSSGVDAALDRLVVRARSASQEADPTRVLRIVERAVNDIEAMLTTTGAQT
jgi:DNA-binding PadR family transcriptional regulator